MGPVVVEQLSDEDAGLEVRRLPAGVIEGAGGLFEANPREVLRRVLLLTSPLAPREKLLDALLSVWK